jgi:pimeloyl-ACP methyl ester carboxylesterase
MSATPSTDLAIAHRSAGTGPPELVFVHGWAGSGLYYDETIAALNLDHVRATSLDLSGHGDSPDGDGEWTLDRIDDEILSVIDAIDAKRSVLLAYSMGGKFVQHFALRHPDRVAGLILVAGTQASSMTIPDEVLESWYARAGNVRAMKELVLPFLTGPVDEAAHDRFAREAARASLPALKGSMRATIDTDFADELGSLDVPTLVVVGGRDEFMPVQLLRDEIASKINGARMVILDCGHEIPLERPRELASLIEAFLAGIGQQRHVSHHN